MNPNSFIKSLIMKTKLTFFTILFAGLFPMILMGQPQVWHTGIAQTNQNLRGAPVVLGQITINPTTAGRAVVRFDGLCASSVGDLIVLAASNSTNWGTNDGNISVECIDTDINTNNFAHTRVYDIAAGNHTFYAIGENYVELDGSGIASIYGSLTVEFFPNAANQPFVEFNAIAQTNINVRGNAVAVGQVSIVAPTAGKVVVNFDGHCYPSVGDLIVLAASNSMNWGINSGNTSVEILNSDINTVAFSHTRVYSVGAGTHTFYALAENYVETAGSGMASIYANLTAEFYPNSSNVEIEFEEVEETSKNVRGAPVVLEQKSITSTLAGSIIARFDGNCYADVGDRIILAASNSNSWGINDGNVAVEAYDNDINHSPFSHTRVYPVSETSTTSYKAIAENYAEQSGNGISSIYGTLLVKYFPESTGSGIEPLNPIYLGLELTPNPVSELINIKLEGINSDLILIEIVDISGKNVLSDELYLGGTSNIQIDLGDLPSGLYLVKALQGNKTGLGRFVKM